MSSVLPEVVCECETITIRPGRKVLVVDDEELNRDLLRDALEARNYRIIEAANGGEAMQKVASDLPDVILLDLMMPGMDGFEVCRRIKGTPCWAHIPILIVTALWERKERLLGIDAGANDFLTKPIDTQDVILRVKNAALTKDLFDQLQIEREKSEKLLRNILPSDIARRMKAGERDITDICAEATVLVCDLAGFSLLAAHVPPQELVHLLNEIFSAFDELVDERGLEKIKTIGDAYMVAGGVPQPRRGHAEIVADLGLAMVREIRRFNLEYNLSLGFRIGLSTGPLVAGVIGRKRFSYDIWGDTVNLACRLESTGQLGAIQVNEAAYEQLKHKYSFAPGKILDLKGCGPVLAYLMSEGQP
jgi:class 3 adenylate cyclase